VWLAGNAGGEDAGGRRNCVRHLLAAAARVHPSHRLQAGLDRLRDCLTETPGRRRLLSRPLAGDEQQLRQPNHLRLPSRLVPGICPSIALSCIQ